MNWQPFVWLSSLAFFVLGTASVANAQRTAVPANRTAASPVRPPVSNEKAQSAAGVASPNQTGAVPEPGQPVPPDAATAEPVPPPTRLELIKQLNFDRRPSSILQTWSALGGKDKTKTERPPSPMMVEMVALRWNVVMGQWPQVASYLKGLEEEESKHAYQAIVTALSQTPSGSQSGTHPAGRAFVEQNVLGTDDVWQLIAAAPGELEEQTVKTLGGLLRNSLAGGNDIDRFLVALREATSGDNPSTGITKRQAAHLLDFAGQSIHLADFLPDAQKAIEESDGEALNLLTKVALARYRKTLEKSDLESAWHTTQAVLGLEDSDEEADREALVQAVELAPQVREELGQQWLEQSFSARPERGMRILATIGKQSSQGLMTHPMDPSYRLRSIQLLSSSVEALLETAPERSTQWREPLGLLALAWMKEAKFSFQYDYSTSIGPRLQYDRYGNRYYMDEQQMMQMQNRNQNQPRPIKVGELLEYRPGQRWLQLIDASLQPYFHEQIARLLLKVNEAEEAFPYIEKLAPSEPDRAEELAEEFLRVWSRANDPNAARMSSGTVFYSYGINRRAEGIPLTRSKQQRNLATLSEWIQRINALPIEKVDQRLVVTAFTKCHSSAEVYDLGAIESVFGSIDDMDPETLARLMQTMRSNLSGLWREPNVQKQNNTNRKKKDIEAEVLQGYEVAHVLIDNALEKNADNWTLMMVKAALNHDELNFRNDVKRSSTFSEGRLKALEEFAQAAVAYANQLGEIEVEDESIDVYETWFYASLGACDLGQIDSEKLPVLTEPARIRDAILALPGEAAERHMSKFANNLMSRLGGVSPAVKFRYLRTGFDIVGDHEQARDARKVFDYYNDLVTEIKIVANIDGSGNVGSRQPFGVFVNLLHTREIERESGGFGRYLQNQNNVQYSYNYGRPTENYRDKFEEAAREALSEHFEVLSVTFQSEDVSSKATVEYGWRVTPYAYLLLKARGTEVDRIPPLRLDLDFLDSSGYVVLPVESPMVPINASDRDAELRPADLVEVVQTLDERQADEQKLVLEVKAKAHGLVPELTELLDLEPDQFDVLNIEDEGVSVTKFDPEADGIEVLSERTWLVSLQGRDDLEELPSQFTFGDVMLETDSVSYQRYVDADLESVDQTVMLEESYGGQKTPPLWMWVTIAVTGLAVGCGIVFVLSRRKPPEVRHQSHLPDEVTPFTVVTLLREIHRTNGLSREQLTQLEAEIEQLEASYFARDAEPDEDLRKVAESWLRKAR